MSRSRKDKGEERKEPATASNTGFNDTSNRVLEGTRIIEGREEIKKLAFEEIKHAQRKWDAYGDRKLPISALTTEQMWQLTIEMIRRGDRKSTRLNSSHMSISYAV